MLSLELDEFDANRLDVDCITNFDQHRPRGRWIDDPLIAEVGDAGIQPNDHLASRIHFEPEQLRLSVEQEVHVGSEQGAICREHDVFRTTSCSCRERVHELEADDVRRL